MRLSLRFAWYEFDVPRNAAKAKSRDKTGNFQKNFFGRRRLNLFSKGLSAHSCLDTGTPGYGIRKTTTTAQASFNFGHAKKSRSLLQTETTDLFVSDNGGSRSLASKEHEKISISSVGTSSSATSKVTTNAKPSPVLKPTKSKLLQQLDILEREFLKP
jgi:hypothetical protein